MPVMVPPGAAVVTGWLRQGGRRFASGSRQSVNSGIPVFRVLFVCGDDRGARGGAGGPGRRSGGAGAGDRRRRRGVGPAGVRGHARFGGYRWSWEMARPPGWLVEQSPGPLAAVLAAAGHPARLRVLQLLVRGPRPIAELQTELSPASQGQLYHHLKTLGAAGLIEQPERGVYRVPPHAIFPVLALLAR